MSLIDKTIDTYNQYAEVYDNEVIAFWEQFPKTVVSQFATSLSGKKILNVGSGSGRDAQILRNAGLEVVCVDASSAMVGLTKQQGFESYVQTFDEMNFAPGSFDGIWAYTSLIHIETKDMLRILKKLHTFLKNDGVFLVGAMRGEGGLMVERDSMPNSERYFQFYNPDELQDLVENIGFTLIYEELYQPHTSVYINQIFRKEG